MSNYRIDDEEREQQNKSFINGLKQYKNKGIPIYIDGRETEEVDWGKILKVSEDGAFYMGDYVGADEGKLREIRFDKVYYK